jgi:hypothetical protein
MNNGQWINGKWVEGKAPLPTVTDVDYSTKITINGKPTFLSECVCCGYVPHQWLSNGKRICGFCGTEHE